MTKWFLEHRRTVVKDASANARVALEVDAGAFEEFLPEPSGRGEGQRAGTDT